MRLCFNIALPEDNLQVIGGAPLSSRSLKGYVGRELNRFFPVILCLETLCQINEWHHKQHKLPILYRSGVRYEAEPPGQEEWLDIITLLRKQKGDCEDIACARVAEIRHHLKIAAVPAIRWKNFQTGFNKIVTLVHVLVLWPDGKIEDPSKVLGMGGEFNCDQ